MVVNKSNGVVNGDEIERTQSFRYTRNQIPGVYV